MDTATNIPHLPHLPPRAAPAREWLWSANDARIAAREDDALAATDLNDAIARCLAEGLS